MNVESSAVNQHMPKRPNNFVTPKLAAPVRPAHDELRRLLVKAIAREAIRAMKGAK